MKVLIKTTDNIAYYIFEDNVNVVLKPNYTDCGLFKVLDINESNGTLLSVPTVPADWKPGKYTCTPSGVDNGYIWTLVGS